MTENKENIVKKFAAKNGYNIITFYKDWKGNKVFAAENNTDEEVVGYPIFIVLSLTNEVRFADNSEILSIFDITAMPEGYSDSLT